MININREDLIKRLSEKSGYYQQDIRILLKSLDAVIFDCFSEVDADNDIIIQIAEGIKIKACLVPERDRIDPRSGEAIVVKPTVKPGVRYSQWFRQKIQENYENKKK